MARRIKRIRTGNSMSRIEGMEEVRQLLQSLQERAPDVYMQELEAGGKQIETMAKSNVHSISGQLSASIHTEILDTATIKGAAVVAGGASAPHAHLVEFGHRHLNKYGDVVGDVPAHPFMRKAFEQYKAQLIAKLEADIDRIIR